MTSNSSKIRQLSKSSLFTDSTLFQKSELSNGALLVTEKIDHVRSVSLGAWVKTGSRHEAPGENGVSHFVEHMLFKGTRKRSAFDIAHAIESVGVGLNAFTGKELTCYYAHILDENLPLAVDVLTDMLIDSRFLQEEFEKEKQVILEEIDDANEVPEDKIHDYFFADLFEDHPLAQPILGSSDSVHALQNQQLKDFVARTYRPDSFVFAAAGNVDHDQLAALLDAALPNAKPGLNGEQTHTATLSRKRKARIYNEKSLLSHLCIGSHLLHFADKRKYAALILNTLIGGGMSSRLFQSVREKHALCYNIYSYLEFFSDTGIFCIYAGADKEKSNFAHDLIARELETIRMNGISVDELEATKSQFKGNLMLGLEDTYSRMNRIAKMEIYLQNYYSLDQVLDGISKVSLSDIQNVAEIMLHPDGLVTSILCSNIQTEEEAG